MMIYISCAKTMAKPQHFSIPGTSTPRFESEAIRHAINMSQFNPEELGKMLHINTKLAAENYLRFQNFFSPETSAAPAILSYTGIVFKRLNAKDFTTEDLEYAQKHLFITSFLYGLLRPLDLIRPYRLEGNVRLPDADNTSIFDFWKPLLTSYLINEVQKQGGLLINLASSEMQDLFFWDQVKEAVQIISPEFQVYKNGRLSTVVVYTKMCRGEMTRFLLKNRIENPDDLRAFEWEGFVYNESESTPGRPVFILGCSTAFIEL